MQMLKDILGTAYCYDDFSRELGTCSAGPYDMADVKFTSNMYNKIRELMWRGVIFIDSKDALRNRLLEQIAQAIEVQNFYSPSKRTPLPVIQKRQSIEDYIRSLDETKIYEKSPRYTDVVNWAFILLITVLNPNIQFYLSTDIDRLFDYTRKWLGDESLTELLEKETEFNYYFAGVMFPITIDYNRQREFNFPGIGVVRREDLIRKVRILPASFGTLKLVRDDLWDPLVQTCVEYITPEFKIINFSMKNYVLNANIGL